MEAMEIGLYDKRLNLVVGLNSAIQRRLVLRVFDVGEVNRAVAASVGVGGKGQDVLLASSCMTLRAIRETKLLQFVGHGAEGDTLLAILEQVVSPSNLLTVRTKGRCRTCITLIDQSSNKSTELIEPSDNISEMEVIELLQLAHAVCNKLSNDINENNIEAAKVAGLAIMGSLPPGVSTDTYAQIVSRVCDCNSRIILDTVVGLPRTLEQ